MKQSKSREALLASPFAIMQPLGVYISVPFCKAKCTFCNFASDAFAPGRMDRYIERLCQEIATSRTAANTLGVQLPDTLDTLYFGGGTPSLLSPTHIRQIFSTLRSQFNFAHGAEITLECAPGQLSDETIRELMHQGLNRVSLGVQSFVDRESSAIGRLHTREICLAEIARIRTAGIPNLSLDLIVGLPQQTEQSWVKSLDIAIASGVPHISLYMLEVDEDSRLGREMLASGSRYSAAKVPSEDEAADWYQLACQRLAAAGIHQYEISNFAREGYRSLHNLKYWHRYPYLGFGLDAHSMLPTLTGAIRFANTSDLGLYSADAPAPNLVALQPTPPTPRKDCLPERSEGPAFTTNEYAPPMSIPEIDIVTTDQAFEETLFLGLRLNEGVSVNDLRRQFGQAMWEQALPAIEELNEAGLLHVGPNRISLTDHGRIVSNEVFSRLLFATPV